MKYFTKQNFLNNQKNIGFFGIPISEKDKSRAEKLKKQGQKVIDEYNEHCRQIEPYLSDSVKNYIINNAMHDCGIVSSGFVGDDFHMNINSSNSVCTLNEITFINAKILEIDSELEGVSWISEEVYITTTGYELHVLFHAKKGVLGEMVIIFDELIVK